MLLPSAEAEAKPIIVKTIPLALNYKKPEQTRIGPLHYRGGLVILSTKARCGGFLGPWGKLRRKENNRYLGYGISICSKFNL